MTSRANRDQDSILTWVLSVWILHIPPVTVLPPDAPPPSQGRVGW